MNEEVKQLKYRNSFIRGKRMKNKFDLINTVYERYIKTKWVDIEEANNVIDALLGHKIVDSLTDLEMELYYSILPACIFMNNKWYSNDYRTTHKTN